MNHTMREGYALRSRAGIPVTMKARKLLMVTFIAMVLIDIGAVGGVWSEVTATRPDFFDLYETGKFFRHAGVPDYVGTSREAATQQSRVASPSSNRIDYLHPPFEILLFMPLSILPPLTSYKVWYALNLIMLWAVPLLLWRNLSNLHGDFHYITIFFGSFLFVFVALIQGQDSILLLILITAGFVLLQQDRKTLAGAVIGLGMFKFFIAVPLVLALAFSERSRFLRGFVFSSFATVAASCVLVGPRNTLAYYLQLLHLAANPNSKLALSASTMPNLRGLILTLTPSFSGSSSRIIVPAVLSLLILFGMLLWAYKNQDLPLALKFAVFVIICCVASFHFFLHNAIILLLPLLLAANEFASSAAKGLPQLSFAGAACLMYVFPNVFPMRVGVPIISLASLVIAGALLMRAKEVRAAGA